MSANLNQPPRPVQPEPQVDGPCEGCTKPPKLCICDRTQPLACRHKIVVLQHPQESRHVLSTLPLLMRMLPKTKVRIGLSWANLAAALGGAEGAKEAETKGLRPRRWFVLYPSSLPKALRPDPQDLARRAGPVQNVADNTLAQAFDVRGKPMAVSGAHGFIVLDGSWSQAKALWWRNPWLQKLPRLILPTGTISAYGRLRREPKPGYVSTLEAAAGALDAMGESPQVSQALVRAMRTFAQRVRDNTDSKGRQL